MFEDSNTVNKKHEPLQLSFPVTSSTKLSDQEMAGISGGVYLKVSKQPEIVKINQVLAEDLTLNYAEIEYNYS